MAVDHDPPKGPSRPVLTVLSRRDLVLGACAAGAAAQVLTALLARAGGTEPSAPPAASEAVAPPPARIPLSDGLTPSFQFTEALDAILASAEPAAGEPLSITLPELAENGNVVPYTIAVENPMTDTDYVRTLHLLSTANPQAVVAAFHLVPATGKASVSGRMRLAKTQDVVALAQLSSGQMLVAVRKVEVTIGGCGNE